MKVGERHTVYDSSAIIVSVGLRHTISLPIKCVHIAYLFMDPWEKVCHRSEEWAEKMIDTISDSEIEDPQRTYWFLRIPNSTDNAQTFRHYDSRTSTCRRKN